MLKLQHFQACLFCQAKALTFGWSSYLSDVISYGFYFFECTM